jgi:hypothetical protein
VTLILALAALCAALQAWCKADEAEAIAIEARRDALYAVGIAEARTEPE